MLLIGKGACIGVGVLQFIGRRGKRIRTFRPRHTKSVIQTRRRYMVKMKEKHGDLCRFLNFTV